MDLIDIAIIGALLLLALVVGLATTRQTAKPTAPRERAVKAAALKLPATKGFPREVVGTKAHQEVLAGICGGFSDDGHELDCEAVLRAEGEAVRVEILGQAVGELADEDAARFLKELAVRGHAGEAVIANAKVTGGWRTGPGEGAFTVRLAFGWPLKLPSAKAKTAA